MKYTPEGEPDCTTIRSKHLCLKCIHHQFCSRMKNTLQEDQKVVKKETRVGWAEPGEGAGRKGKFGGEYD